MFTMPRSKHRMYSFCTNISVFLSPTNRTKNFPKFQTQKYNPFTYIQPRLLRTLQRNLAHSAKFEQFLLPLYKEGKFEKIYETANPFNCVAHWGVV